MLKATLKYRGMKQVFRTRPETGVDTSGAVVGAAIYDILISKPLDRLKDSSFHIHVLPEHIGQFT